MLRQLAGIFIFGLLGEYLVFGDFVIKSFMLRLVVRSGYITLVRTSVLLEPGLGYSHWRLRFLKTLYMYS